MPSGYYLDPTIHDNTVVFVSEDDLWTVPAGGGIARRLTSNLGEVSHPNLSPDGAQLAFVGREEGGAEVYLMPAVGGKAKRLTYLGGSACVIAGWSEDGRIIFANSSEHWYFRFTQLYQLDTDGGTPERLNYGLARDIARGPNGAVVIGRNTQDPAYWKRYRGGRIGQLWIGSSGHFQRLLPDIGNLASPMWLYSANDEGRIYFISDHEGIGNLYSCLPSGADIRRHTDHQDFYARNASTDGDRIVYHAGAKIYLFDPEINQSDQIPIEYHSPQVQRNRKFVSPAGYLDDWLLHPTGQVTTITSRGSLFTFANWEGPVLHYGDQKNQSGKETITDIRYRLPGWLNDGLRLIAVTDANGEETFVIFDALLEKEPEVFPNLDIGRPEELKVNPHKPRIAFSNNRYELVTLDLETQELSVIDRGAAFPISGFDWSPDGEWLAYSVSISNQVSVLKLWNLSTGEITQLTNPILRDVEPAFDPRGRYLYFLSYRVFDPVHDNLQFELSFPYGMKPYLITLQKDRTSPFQPVPLLMDDDGFKIEDPTEEDSTPVPDGKTEQEPETQADPEGKKEGSESETEQPTLILTVDLEGIQRRILAFPVPDGLYGRISGTKDGGVLYSRYLLEGALHRSPNQGKSKSKGSLWTYNFSDQKEEMLITGMGDFQVSRDGETLIYQDGYKLRVVKAGEKPTDDESTPSRKSGWIDLNRVRVSVDPSAEWRQMFREAWRLQRDQFWTEDMSQVDWLEVYDRYLPLVDRVGSRAEFSDLMWEMQGELGTSHAYEYGGDYRLEPDYAQGFLGADFTYHSETGGWEIVRIHSGDSWDPKADSPLNQPGVGLKVGDILVAISGIKLHEKYSPAQALVNLANEEVSLAVIFHKDNQDAEQEQVDEKPVDDKSSDDESSEGTSSEDSPPKPEIVIVKVLPYEGPTRYRQWVELNRQHVHQASDGKVGYIHIPDMSAWGYAEFHRGFLAEVDRLGLIVDVRFNRGGNVSSLLLEKLARRRIGYQLARWSKTPAPYPPEAIAGPMVALTNEYAGSDGDIFSHGFKLMGLGPLVGKRTWGGVIGIWPRHSLIDGTTTTQPEFSTWFSDVGWQVENYGVDPDIEVDILPQDYAKGLDTQLDRAIQECTDLLKTNPPQAPDFSERPNKAAPRLNSRS